MRTLVKLIRLQKELQLRKLAPEVGIYRAWVKELIEQEGKE